jgi:ribosomal 30S subunit maturation factor RimM
VLVPFSGEIIRGVDRARRVVRIDPPEGLLE